MAVVCVHRICCQSDDILGCNKSWLAKADRGGISNKMIWNYPSTC